MLFFLTLLGTLSSVHTRVSLTGTIPGEEPPTHLYPETPELLGPQRNSEGEVQGRRAHLAALYSPVGLGGKPFDLSHVLLSNGSGFPGPEAMGLEWLVNDRGKAYNCPVVSPPFFFLPLLFVLWSCNDQ